MPNDPRDNDRLHVAARNGNAPEILMLLEAKADPNQVDRGFTAPLSWAAMSGKPEAVKALIDGQCSHQLDNHTTTAYDTCQHSTGGRVPQG